MADPYQVLGVAKTASQDEIRKAYRKLAKENHPDLHPGNAAAEQRFKAVAAAYDIIGDEEKRKRFDAGEIDDQGAAKPERRYYRDYADAEPGSRYNWGGPSGDAAGDDELFETIFRSGRGGRSSQSSRSQSFPFPGADVRYALTLGFLEAANGASKTVTTPDGRTLDLKIPPGIRDDQTLRLKGQGEPGFNGGPPGDALVTVSVSPDPTFTRDGNDIRSVVPITLAEALGGATVRIETITGAVNAKVPKGSNTGSQLRLRGKGIHPASGPAGDQIVELRVVLPPQPDAELIDFVTDWERRHPYDPRQKRARS